MIALQWVPMHKGARPAHVSCTLSCLVLYGMWDGFFEVLYVQRMVYGTVA